MISFWCGTLRLALDNLAFNPRDDHAHRVILFCSMSHAIKKRFAKKSVKQSHTYLAAAFIVLALLMENRSQNPLWPAQVNRFYDNARRYGNGLQINTTPSDIVKQGLAVGNERGIGFSDCKFQMSRRFVQDMWSVDVSTVTRKKFFLQDFFGLNPEEYSSFNGFK